MSIVYRRAPEGYYSWGHYWYVRLKEGASVGDLVRDGYSKTDVRHTARLYARQHGLEIIEAIQPKRAKR